MERICSTGIKVLGRRFKVMHSGAIVLLPESLGQATEVVWWPPINIAKEILSTYKEYNYYIDEDGYLMRE